MSPPPPLSLSFPFTLYYCTNTTISLQVYKKRLANAKKGYIPLPNGEIAPPTALVGRRVVGEAVEMEVPAAGLTNSLLAKLFRSIDTPVEAAVSASRGAGKAGNREDDMDGNVTTARRSSRIVRPESWEAPFTPGVPTGPRELGA